MSVSTIPAPKLGERLCENGFEHPKILPAIDDAHGGVIVDLNEPMDPQHFATLLRSSLLHWNLKGKHGVWIKLPINLVNLVETAVKEGFWYHHAEPSYLMLVYWIPQTGCTIPINASHRVAVAAIVLNQNKEVLVVQEKRGRFHGIGYWKLPTGVVDAGEEVFAAAIREVKEETGVDTEFVEILAFRIHSLGNQICHFFACCALFLLRSKSKNWKLKQLSGCRSRNSQFNHLLRSMNPSST
ncbi:nudix hydrolase 2 isoform X2 [Arachis hypogaea]|uniref:nudix hydrolase 2 isoform X2 n=1 Tax=Arachis hypogaea TaxID=3818 RepID=UPI003B21EE54